MKDTILGKHLEAFSSSRNLDSFPESKRFCLFVNHNIISRNYVDEFDIEDVTVDGDADMGIDGVAIIVNGRLVSTIDEFNDLKAHCTSYRVSFTFIQSTISSNFDSGKIGIFLNGVEAFFNDSIQVRKNSKIQELIEVKNCIYDNFNVRDDLPSITLHYATTGSWKSPSDIMNLAKNSKDRLDKLNLFSKNEIEFYGNKELCNLCKYNSRKIEKTIPISASVTLPNILSNQNIKQAFLGFVSARDYIKIITNDSGELSRNLFCDNVRDFQGDDNPTNKKILNTMDSDNERLLLPLLNNGITIIADEVHRISDDFTLENFQIVNGCQTSYILFEKREKIQDDDTKIVLKIIQTTDLEVINKIIEATNSQTEVKQEAFESLRQFHRNLQEFYKAMEKKVKSPLYYERRSKEYFNDSQVKQTQVISLARQIKAYIATEIGQPHNVHRYFGELLSSNSGKIFKNEKDFGKYFASAYLLNRIEYILNDLYSEEGINLKWKFMLAYIIYGQMKKENGKFDFEKTIATFDNEQTMKRRIIDIYKVIESIPQSKDFNCTRSKNFTDILARHFDIAEPALQEQRV